MADPTWLDRSPAGDGWRYLHDDGRVETAIEGRDVPPGFVPPGFEQPDLGAQPNLGIAPLEAPTVEAPVVTEPVAAPMQPGSSQSGSTSVSFRGATLPVEGSPAASDKLSRRADAEARRQVGLYAPSIAAQKAAVQGVGQAQAGAATAQSQGFADEATMLRDQNEARAREVAEIDQRSQKWTAELREAIDSVPTMDVKRAFHNQTNLESASMGIAAFMGGFLQPVLGTNTPMEIINKAVDRDIEEQKNAQEQAQRKIWNLKDLAKSDMDSALWELNQTDTARLTTLTALQRDVQAKVQTYQSDVFRKQGEKLLADIDKAVVDTYQNIYTTTRGFMETQRHNMRMESMQAMQIKAAEAARQAAAGSAGKADREKRAIRDPRTNKVVGYLTAGTDGDASKYNEKQAGAYSAAEQLLKLNKLIADNGTLWKKSNWLSDPKAQELRGVWSGILGDLIRAKTGAAANEAELKRIELELPFPSKINADTARNLESKLDEVIGKQNALNSASLQPLDGEETLGYNFADSVKGLRAEYSTNDPAVPVKSMHEGMLMLDAAGEDPAKVQTTVRKILAAAEDGASVDSGRADIEAAIARLSQIPRDVRSLPSVDGDVDPVRLLESMLISGRQTEINREEQRATDAAVQQFGLENPTAPGY